MALNGWLADLLGYKDVYDRLGTLMPRRSLLRFLNGDVTDNPVTGTTDVSFGSTVEHGDLVMADGLHGIITGTYNNAEERVAVTPVVGLLGKVKMQLNDGSLWVVTLTAPSTYAWRSLTGGVDPDDPLSIITSATWNGWWEDTIVQSSGLASQWTDDSGAGNHFTATGTARAAYAATDATLNNKQTLTGNGTTVSMRCLPAMTGATYWVCCVMKHVTATNLRRAFSSPGTGGRNEILLTGGGGAILGYEGPGTGTPYDVLNPGDWRVVELFDDGATMTLKVGGNAAVTVASTRTTTAGPNLAIFSDSSGVAQFWNGAFASIALTTGVPNSTQRTNWKNRLADKYGAVILT